MAPSSAVLFSAADSTVLFSASLLDQRASVLGRASSSVFGDALRCCSNSSGDAALRLSKPASQPKHIVANSSTNSVSSKGRVFVPPMHQDNWNNLSLGSRTLTDLGVRELRNANNRLKIFSGTANPQLSQEIACYMGLNLGQIKIKRFADGEIYVQLEESVRGCDVFLVQPTCPPANENVMELLIMIDACRRASAKTITAVIPYFGYARADRKTQGRESIAAKLAANLITEAGANRVLTCDLHSGQSMGYFDIPVDHVYGQPVILDYLASKMISSDDLVVVSPDVGGVARARAFAKKLSDAPLAIVDKRRHGHNVSEVMNLIGDVKGKVAVMVDDMIDTAGTIANSAALLHAEGAKEVYACCTHAVFR
uniref:Ribose-phosphate pyrophosphokinase n=1 Tax=Physcomitrium patens TaxID=3218 RepID=A0A7I4CIU1_PHYPA